MTILDSTECEQNAPTYLKKDGFLRQVLYKIDWGPFADQPTK